MPIEFYKYQGTGNDFIMIDNRLLQFSKNNTKLVATLCDRKFGIGADGLILLEDHPEYDFKMVYYNSDGNLSSMCGNGGRCLVQFARFLGIIKHEATFEAVDGLHFARILENNWVSLGMNDVKEVRQETGYVFLDTGSPHHVQLVENVTAFDVVSEGRNIRHDIYGKAGANVNFVTPLSDNSFRVRTYERGVENETLSCGTGVTAVALAMYTLGKTTAKNVTLETPGGTLQITFEPKEGHFEKVFLNGPALQVFKGTWA
ncbi:MAG: diaminopimelate epimerase [Flavobacteriaceae bacterium]|nr:diaminopimelate epimerase [Flavobacteriaceae bacterium]|tara:strand:- start:63990 stop:64766 length:777 start_codon:yes stop_codon:yes gene_type:complete